MRAGASLRTAAVALGLLACASLAAAQESPVEVPPENQRRGVMPDLAPAEAMARRLLDAIVADDPESVVDTFFPRAPFLALKAMKQPGAYHDHLVATFVADVHREHKRLAGMGPLSFGGLERGGCVWKARQTEANVLPYWSCYRNRIVALTGSGPEAAPPPAPGTEAAPATPRPKRVEIALQAMINWGPAWYVTHLGAPRSGRGRGGRP